MRNNIINWSGKQILTNQDELEDGHVEIVVDVSDFLDEVDTDVLREYVEYHLDMRHEDDFESDLDDFQEEDIVEKLEYLGYNFSKNIGEEGCIEFLEDCGYTITDNRDIDDSIDFVHQGMLDEITKKFLESSWEERDLMYKKL